MPDDAFFFEDPPIFLLTLSQPDVKLRQLVHEGDLLLQNLYVTSLQIFGEFYQAPLLLFEGALK